jgi:hypothetical protein
MAAKQIYTLDDLYYARATSIVDLGVENVLNSLLAYGQFLVEDTSEQLNLFSEETDMAREFWGGVGRISFEEVGEFGQAETQKDIKDQEVQFPLRKIAAASGWSKEFFKRAKGAEIRKIMLDMDNGFNQRIRDEIKTAIFKNTATQWQSSIYPQDGVLTKIQPFLNADGATIPDAPNGTQFVGASHQHYLGVTGSSIATVDVDYLLGHVREHVVGEVALFVDGSMPATLAGLSGTKYVALTPSVLVNQTASTVALATFNPAGDRNNMLMGYWDGHPVYTRSWVPTGYLAALAVGAADKPLKRRVDPLYRGMQTDGVVTNGQIVAQEFYAYMGFGAFNRAAGAVLDSTTQGSYTKPSGLLR